MTYSESHVEAMKTKEVGSLPTTKVRMSKNDVNVYKQETSQKFYSCVDVPMDTHSQNVIRSFL